MAYERPEGGQHDGYVDCAAYYKISKISAPFRRGRYFAGSLVRWFGGSVVRRFGRKCVRVFVIQCARTFERWRAYIFGILARLDFKD